VGLGELGELGRLRRRVAERNPGGGFGTGCTSLAPEFDCVGNLGQGPSKMFALKGADKVTT
jgi:hypothetical protein